MLINGVQDFPLHLYRIIANEMINGQSAQPNETVGLNTW